MISRQNTSFCFLLLLFTIGVVRAQTCHYSGQVIAADGTPVPFATITSADGQQGRYADQNGFFELPFCTDSVQISALGFRPIRARTRITPMRLQLTPQPIELSEVVVRGEATGKAQSFGFYQLVRLPPTINFSPNTACTIAAYVANPGEQVGAIQAISYRLAPNRSVILTSFVARLHVFADSLTSTGEHYPARDLLLKNAIVMVSPTARTVSYRLDQPVTFPTAGVWVAIELIGYVDREARFHQLNDHEFGQVTAGKTGKGKLFAPYFAMKKQAGVGGRVRMSYSRQYTRLRSN